MSDTGYKSWRLPEVYDLDTSELIVDEVAVERAVQGQRAKGPWITRTEAIEAMQIMLRRDVEIVEIADRIGCEERTVHRWLAGEYTPASPVMVVPASKLRRSELPPAELAAVRARGAELKRLERGRNMAKCAVDGCSFLSRCRGRCAKHYKALMRELKAAA